MHIIFGRSRRWQPQEIAGAWDRLFARSRFESQLDVQTARAFHPPSRSGIRSELRTSPRKEVVPSHNTLRLYGKRLYCSTRHNIILWRLVIEHLADFRTQTSKLPYSDFPTRLTGNEVVWNMTKWFDCRTKSKTIARIQKNCRSR